MSVVAPTEERPSPAPPDHEWAETDDGPTEPADTEVSPLAPARPRGMRIGRLRIRSVAKIAAVFSVLGYLVTLATVVIVWSVLSRFGFVDDLEERVVTSFGVDAFEIDGRDLFDLFTVGAGAFFAMGLVLVVLLALVYNATCALFGGLAVETTPVRGWRRYRRLRPK